MMPRGWPTANSLRLFQTLVLIVAALVFSSQLALAQFTQQGSKLAGTGAVGNAQQGSSVALSGDGKTAIVGGPGDNSQTGAVWVYTRSGGVWTQQGTKLVGTGALGGSVEQGVSIALSGDGNTAIVGGLGDNPSGAAWVFTRSNGVWTQQGSKLVGTGALGDAEQGVSVALSADGNTAIVGGLETTARPGRRGSLPVAAMSGPSRVQSWSALARFRVLLVPNKANPSRCPPTATPPLWAALRTTAKPGRCGSIPAAAVSGPSRVQSWATSLRL
jgi:hypothetical protein